MGVWRRKLESYMMEPKIAIILPAYNEAATIGVVLHALRALPHNIAAHIVVVNDGSTDGTAAIASQEGVEVISHAVNRGLGHVFRTAVDHCLQQHIDIMVFFDADGQFDASDIPKVITPIVSGACDVVPGSRFLGPVPHEMPKAKVFGNIVLARFISAVSGRTIHDVSCGFRAYSREALFHINVLGSFTYTQEVILDLAFKGVIIQEVPISVRYFKDRVSSVSSSLRVYGWRVFKIIVRTIRDYQPLRFFGFIGGVVFLAGLMLDIWLMVHFFNTGSFTPYKAVGFTGAFLNFLGITIWFIGLVADMLNRMRLGQENILYQMKKNRFHE